MSPASPKGAPRSALAVVAILVVGAAAFQVSSARDLGASAPETVSASAEPTPIPTSERPATTVGESPPATTPGDPTPVTTAPVGQPAADPDAWMDSVGSPGRTFLGVSTATDSDAEIDAFAAAAGRIPDVVMVSRDWASGGFDRETVERLTVGGHLPMIAWEPWDHTQVLSGDRLRAIQPAYSLASIIDGHHDDLIRAWAAEAARWGKPVALRFAHEMNGYWYPWSESANGNSDGEYVAAWRHVHGIFEEEGATEVIWVWSPNLSDPTLTDIDALWPGDEFVDWVGLVGYLGNGIDATQWTPSFDDLFGPTISELREFTDRPIVITEIGATEDGGKKAAWITDILAAVGERDDVVGLMWFEIDKEADWRIVSSEEARAAFAAGIADDDTWGIPRTGHLTRTLAPN